MTTAAVDTIAFPDGLILQEFRPFALYDDRLDCIRVITRDCSVTDVRVNGRITLLEDNHAGSNKAFKYVGFTIKGAKHLCRECGFDLNLPVRISDLLDVIVAASPEPVVRAIVDGIARPLAESEGIEPLTLSGRAA